MKRKSKIGVLILLCVVSLWGGGVSLAGTELVGRFWAKKAAPEFVRGLDWLNVEGPLKLSDLKGKFVLLDFWTYCCINCMNIIPDLKKLEAKYPEELVIIGVHSAKFKTEQETENIREAILRYGVDYPVVNDNQLQMWKEYRIPAWPSAVLIDPLGIIIHRRSGEDIFEPIDKILKTNMKKYAEVLNYDLIKLALEKQKTAKSILYFPGKIIADDKSQQLFIADSGNNRILVTDFSGSIKSIIGSGQKGLQDGKFKSAQFSDPQGLAFQDPYLYVADRENHSIRRIDLKKRKVKTIAGTGQKGHSRHASGEAVKIAINGPWDLVLDKNVLFIAMAGPHQIWALDLKTKKIKVHAGSGIENIIDGPLGRSAMAQPSGITTDGKQLYFADSEVSAIRSADIWEKGWVRTIIGHGLFEYGDVDGNAKRAQFQHPLGITYVDGQLYVADTYNNKIKRVDPSAQTSQTYAGSGQDGTGDGPALEANFNEPGGIDFAQGKLFVADTNNHLIRVINMGQNEVSTLQIRDEKPKEQNIVFDFNNFIGDKVILDRKQAAAIQNLNLSLDLPKEHKILAKANPFIRLFTKDGTILKTLDIKENMDSYYVDQDIMSDTLYAEMVLYYCREGKEALCLVRNVLFQIPLDRGLQSSNLDLSYKVPTTTF